MTKMEGAEVSHRAGRELQRAHGQCPPGWLGPVLLLLPLCQPDHLLFSQTLLLDRAAVTLCCLRGQVRWLQAGELTRGLRLGSTGSRCTCSQCCCSASKPLATEWPTMAREEVPRADGNAVCPPTPTRALPPRPTAGAAAIVRLAGAGFLPFDPEKQQAVVASFIKEAVQAGVPIEMVSYRCVRQAVRLDWVCAPLAQ